MDELDLEPFSKLLRDLLVHPETRGRRRRAGGQLWQQDASHYVSRRLGEVESLYGNRWFSSRESPQSGFETVWGRISPRFVQKCTCSKHIYGWLQHVMMLIWQERLSHLSKNM